MKVLVQSKNGQPFSPTAQIAAIGFAQRGWTIELADTPPSALSSDVPFVGSVGWTERALAAGGICLASFDYPEPLFGFLGRTMQEETLEPCLTNPSRWPLFIKPKKQKLFPGTVIASEVDVQKVGNAPHATPVWTCDVVPIEVEYRVYILQGQVLACCRYLGPWARFPDSALIDAMVRNFANPPHAYCLDVGILSSGETVLIEATEILAASNYVLPPYLHSQMIEVRWAELTGGTVPEFPYPEPPPFLTRP